MIKFVRAFVFFMKASTAWRVDRVCVFNIIIIKWRLRADCCRTDIFTGCSCFTDAQQNRLTSSERNFCFTRSGLAFWSVQLFNDVQQWRSHLLYFYFIEFPNERKSLQSFSFQIAYPFSMPRANESNGLVWLAGRMCINLLDGIFN